ncbi:unnamed protein product [Rhizoctonia solani]|uniref:Uncharacterized protein n=1 Tax=Rhizoctonia solani TaxID=456999 RepID=A0A8H2ZVS3_9AGAM|nr:unnamed protein product [Rhizoctonia solani]
MHPRVESQTSLDCSAEFLVYSLLSGFGSITERERDAIRFVLELVPCSMNDRRMAKIPIPNEAYTLAQFYLPELRVMASRHSYVQKGPLKNPKQAQALLNIILSPLFFHLSSEERKQILGSIDNAEALLSNPLDVLNELVAAWKIRHLELFTNWRSLPIAGVGEYYFGIKLPVPLTLEDVLTPLPYPHKLPQTVWARYQKAPNQPTRSTPRGRTLPRKPINFQPIASRSVKKSELKALDSRHQCFVLPDLTRTSSDSSSVSTDDYGIISLNSDGPLLEDEVFEESTWDLVEDWSELRCHHGGRACCIYAGCGSVSRSGGEPSKHGGRIIGQWRRLIRRR